MTHVNPKNTFSPKTCKSKTQCDTKLLFINPFKRLNPVEFNQIFDFVQHKQLDQFS